MSGKIEDYWYLLNEDSNFYYLIARGPAVTLSGEIGHRNGVGVLDETCRYLFSSDQFSEAKIRNLKTVDLGGDYVQHGGFNSFTSLWYCHEDFRGYVWADSLWRGTATAQAQLNSSTERYFQLSPSGGAFDGHYADRGDWTFKIPLWLCNLLSNGWLSERDVDRDLKYRYTDFGVAVTRSLNFDRW